MMGGGLKFLAPAGRHVYRNVESLPIQALAGRHVYHVSAASSESKTYCRIYIEMLMPVFRPSGAACVSCFGCIVRIQNILSNLYRNVNACLSPQRGGMSIVCRCVQLPRSRGAQCV